MNKSECVHGEFGSNYMKNYIMKKICFYWTILNNFTMWVLSGLSLEVLAAWAIENLETFDSGRKMAVAKYNQKHPSHLTHKRTIPPHLSPSNPPPNY